MFRISLLLWLVALAALNLALLKYTQALIELSPKFAGLIALMPLFDFFVLGLYIVLTGRFRFSLIRRPVSGSFLGSVTAVSGAILALGTLSSLLFPEIVLGLLDVLYTRIDQWIGISNSPPGTLDFLMGGSLGILASGPAICVAIVLGYIHSRFRLEITRREVA